MNSFHIATISASIVFTGTAFAGACEIAKPFVDAKAQTMAKGPELKPVDPVPGVKYIEPQDAMKNFADPNWVFVDVRPATLFSQCHVRKSLNHEFAHPKNTANKLTKEIVSSLTNGGKTIVFLCNSFECYRSLNAAIESVCEWGIKPEQVKWLGKGVPGVVAAFSADYRKYTEGKNCADFLK